MAWLGDVTHAARAKRLVLGSLYCKRGEDNGWDTGGVGPASIIRARLKPERGLCFPRPRSDCRPVSTRELRAMRPGPEQFDAANLPKLNEDPPVSDVRATQAAVRVRWRKSIVAAFLVVFSACTAQEAASVLADIKNRFSRIAFDGASGSFNSSFSAGIAECGPGELSRSELIGLADRALYAAKAVGRNRIELCPHCSAA